MRWIVLPIVICTASAGCSGGSQADQTTQQADTMTAVAQAAYDATIFDSITWESDSAAVERGQVVYTYSCARCHGEMGLGDAGMTRGADTLRPPSFREPDWAYASDKDGLRRQVFIGTAEGMPHWGLEGLKPRDVDAVAIYIMEGLGKD